MCNVWPIAYNHISGGEGWCANSTCRRVLVTHSDGHQSVQEIKNDFGVNPTDVDAMIAKLLEQGVGTLSHSPTAINKYTKPTSSHIPSNTPLTHPFAC